MASYNNLDALLRAIESKMGKAMSAASKDIEGAMLQETEGFYAQGNPVMYKRTGQLERTPRVSEISGSNSDEQSFRAYLDESGGYPSITYTYRDGGQTTSKAPSMTDVLNLTNYGTTSSSVGKLHPALGRSGYWERAKARMQELLDKNMGKQFK